MSSGVIAYGSLMSRAELARHGIRHKTLIPVTVKGFRRSFSQEPSRRSGHGSQRGVLTVSQDDQHSMNALLVLGLSERDLCVLDEWECGYDRIAAQWTSISLFGDAPSEIVRGDVFIYVGKPHKLNPELEPNADYLELCVNAAAEWGEAFREAFLRTTFVSGTVLAEYASDPL